MAVVVLCLFTQIMAFKKKIDFVQLEREELVEFRPVLIYITAPITSKDFSSQTSNHREFTCIPPLPDGVLMKETKTCNLCLIEVNQDMDRFKQQISASFAEYKKAAHKVVIVNAHGTPEGMLIKENDESNTQVILGGQHLAEFISTHTDGNNLHVLVMAAHGHTFANQFYSYVQQRVSASVSDVMAITYFTSKNKPTTWDMVSTIGNGNVEVTRDLRDFIKSSVRPNNPYKILDMKLKL